jgi:hypothetical protein
LKRGQKRRQEQDEPESSTTTVKKRTIVEATPTDKQILNALNAVLEANLNNQIAECIKRKGNIQDLYEKCVSKTRLPRNAVTEAEEALSIKRGKVGTFLGGQSQKTKKKSVTYWIDLVKSRFDSLVESHENAVETAPQASVPSPKTTIDDPLPKTNTTTKACSAPFSSLLRNDLPDDIRSAFVDILQKTLVRSTDYIINFGIQVRKMILLFKTFGFIIKDDGTVALQARTGEDISKVLPANYKVEPGSVATVAPPHSKTTCNDEYEKDISRLFKMQHLQLIHSTYFGPRGVTDASLKKSPFHSAFVGALPRSKNIETNLEPYIMKLALKRYVTNLENMWRDNKQINRLLNHLLLTLLKIHLAPKREQSYKEYTEKKSL